MKQILADALVDSARMIPFLLVIYVLVEWIENRFGRSIQERIKKAAKAGPFLGAVFGSVPQCGFSVLAAAMYTRRMVTVGTLLAVFLATSDEAVPVILAQPDKAGLVLPLLLSKVVIGAVAGYVVDFALGSYAKPAAGGLPTDDAIDSTGCCEHNISRQDTRRQLVIHPLVHTAKVYAFVFLVSVALNYIIYRIGPHNLGKVFLQHSILQPVLTALVGLIPNCAASVAITQVFLKGGISFGSAIAGLSASGGLGILVLLKENHNTKDTIRVLGLLLGISIAVGIIVQYAVG
ncbi:MAG: arsenic efflux protein [Armatimonadetes bacterium]|nr:arsenic efflux protein [Armatimonadota bacterium]